MTCAPRLFAICMPTWPTPPAPVKRLSVSAAHGASPAQLYTTRTCMDQHALPWSDPVQWEGLHCSRERERCDQGAGQPLSRSACLDEGQRDSGCSGSLLEAHAAGDEHQGALRRCHELRKAACACRWTCQLASPNGQWLECSWQHSPDLTQEKPRSSIANTLSPGLNCRRTWDSAGSHQQQQAAHT